MTLGEKGRTITATEAVVLLCDLILGPGESKSCEPKISTLLTDPCMCTRYIHREHTRRWPPIMEWSTGPVLIQVNSWSSAVIRHCSNAPYSIHSIEITW